MLLLPMAWVPAKNNLVFEFSGLWCPETLFVFILSSSRLFSGSDETLLFLKLQELKGLAQQACHQQATWLGCLSWNVTFTVTINMREPHGPKQPHAPTT